jgi:ABC-type multidrug transport system fused ATPase/permease subunit
MKNVRLWTLGFYYLYIKGTPEERMEFGAKHKREITMQSLAFLVVSTILFLFCAITKLILSIAIILFITSSFNLVIAVFLTGIEGVRYQNYLWDKLEKEREIIRKKQEQDRCEIEQLKARCFAKIEELKDASFACDCYSEFIDNIIRMKREVRNALTKNTLEKLLVEIENNIRFIRKIYGKRKEEERQRSEQQYREQHRRQYSQWTSSRNKSLEDFLKILCLDHNERDMNVIKKRRKELALKYHPDNKETGNLQKMQEINNAFDEIERILR